MPSPKHDASPEPIKAVLYAAKSTIDEKGSIPDQLAGGRKLAAQRGLEVDGEYQDEAASAFSGDRGPGLAQALAHCERLGKCALIVQHSDRLARGDAKNARHLIEIVLWAIKNDVQLLSVQDPEILAGGDLALLLGAIGGMRNNQDSKRKSLAVRDGLRRRARDRGQLAGGPRPYGYRWQGPRGEMTLAIDPAEAEVVKRAFTDTVNGVSQRSMARQLIAEGVPTVHGGPWVQATIRRILTNPIYKGLIQHDGERYPSAYEPIITEELWERANAIRASSARRKGGRWPKGAHLLTKGMLRCGLCDYAMTPRTDPGRKNYEVYECSGRRQRGVDFCPQGSIHRSLVDEALLTDLTAHWLDLDETRRRITEGTTADLVIAREALAQAEREAQKATDALTRIERDYIDGEITAQKWNRLEETLIGERDAAASALERAREHVEEVEQAGTLADANEAVMAHLAAIREAIATGVENAPNLDALRHTIAQLFERVVLLPADHPLTRHMDAHGSGVYLLPMVREAQRAVLPVPDTTVRKAFTM